MKKFRYLPSLILFIFGVVLTHSAFSQEESTKKDDKPVRSPFEATLLIENQTILTPAQGALELIVQHRFGNMENGIEDLYGLYASSNIRLAMQYGITDKLMVGFGTEKDNKMQDFYGKYALLQQTRSGSIPVSVSLFGTISIDARDKDNELFWGKDFKSKHRFSYFGQAIVSRKVTDELSLQLAASYSHFNSVNREWQHDKIGLMAGGRMKVTPSISVLGEYHQPFRVNEDRDYQTDVKPGGALGIEIATSTHAFQVFVSNYKHLNNQKNYVMNTNEFDDEGICIGFNITVRF